jgi:hypothetical protein
MVRSYSEIRESFFLALIQWRLIVGRNQHKTSKPSLRINLCSERRQLAYIPSPQRHPSHNPPALSSLNLLRRHCAHTNLLLTDKVECTMVT